MHATCLITWNFYNTLILQFLRFKKLANKWHEQWSVLQTKYSMKQELSYLHYIWDKKIRHHMQINMPTMFSINKFIIHY